MPKLSDPTGAATPGGAVWRRCAGCGTLAALPPTVERCPGCAEQVPALPSRAERAAALPAAAFTPDDLAEISFAGCVFAAALADVTHHHIGEPGSWDCYGTAPDELARLHAALDQMAEAITQTRTQLATVERSARGKAGRLDGGGAL